MITCTEGYKMIVKKKEYCSNFYFIYKRKGAVQVNGLTWIMQYIELKLKKTYLIHIFIK